MAKRGRPYGQMTHRRRQVLEEIECSIANGESVSYSSLARRCGLYDYQAARRIVKDLQKITQVLI